jgi:hypothetical protein
VNRKILESLEEGKKNSMLSHVISDTFFKMDSYFRMYFMYCNNYYDAIERVKELELREKRFATFLKNAGQSFECNNLDLGSYLIKPVQRICKYPLLFREILKHMDASHPNYDKMVKADEKMKIIADQVNERMKDAENQSKVLKIYKELEGEEKDLVTPTRRLIASLEIDVSTIGNTERKPRVLHIFNDLVLVVGTTKKGFFNGTKIRHRFEMRHVDTIEDFEDHFTVKVSDKDKGGIDKYYFWYSNPILSAQSEVSSKWRQAVDAYADLESMKNRRISGMVDKKAITSAWKTQRTENNRKSVKGAYSTMNKEDLAHALTDEVNFGKTGDSSGASALKAIEALYGGGARRRPSSNKDESTQDIAFTSASEPSLNSTEVEATDDTKKKTGKTRAWKTATTMRAEKFSTMKLTAAGGEAVETVTSNVNIATGSVGGGDEAYASVDPSIRQIQGNVALEAQKKAAAKKMLLMQQMGMSSKGADLFG